MGGQPRSARNKSLDGLRGLCALGILAFHVGDHQGTTIWPLSWISLTGFFLLSGYVITNLMRSELERTSHVDVLGFWLRRAARLLPGLFIVVAVVALLRQDLGAFVTMSPLWNLLSGEGATSQGLGHVWTLALEWQFYLVAPFFIPLLLRRPRAAAIGLPIALLLFVIVRPQPHGLEGYYDTPWRIEGFAIGIALAVAGIGFGRIRVLEAFEPVGRISYGLYLWHFPLIMFIGPMFGLPVLASVALSFVAAVLSWRFVEQPAMRWARNVRVPATRTSEVAPAPAPADLPVRADVSATAP